MKINALAIIVSSVLALGLSGCATTIRGPYDYIESNSDAKIKAVTVSAAVGTSAKMQSTYDDEYVYDAAGNVVKHKQTEYFNFDNSQPNFVVWETDFKVVGGVVLPYRQSVNDVTYVELEYEVLDSQAKGPIRQDNINRQFSTEKQIGFDKYTNRWYPELNRFAVDFRADDKFVVSQRTMYPYRGYVDENVLTLGYDNIALKHYSYSHTKLVEGFNKSFQWNLFQTGNSYRQEDNEFNYAWKVIGKSIVQTDAKFSEKSQMFSLDFEAVQTYNDAGQRTNETWTAKDGDGKLVTIFQQDLKY